MAKQHSNLVCGLVYFADLVEIVVSHWLFSDQLYTRLSNIVRLCIIYVCSYRDKNRQE